MNPGSSEHETRSKRQLKPYNFRAYQYLKIEVWTKVAPFLKSAHIIFTFPFWKLPSYIPAYAPAVYGTSGISIYL